MRLCKHLIFCGVAVLRMWSCSAAAQSAAGGVAPQPASGAAAGQSLAVASADLSSLDRLLPVGKTALKVTVPTVDELGRLTSLVTMGVIRRLDEENFFMEEVVLTSLEWPEPAGSVEAEAQAEAQAEAEETVITLIDGRYHAPTRLLVSEQKVTVQKPSLFLTGASLTYDSGAGRAVMKGPTMAVISDAPRPAAASKLKGGEGGVSNPAPGPPDSPPPPPR